MAAREGKEKYKYRPLAEMTIGVQRMAVTLPVSEQAEGARQSPASTSTGAEPSQGVIPLSRKY